MTAEDFALIILASGLSERFGEDNKLLADLSGKPVISHVIDNLAPVDFGLKLAVASGGDNVTDLLEQAGFTCVQNTEPERGQGSSLAIGAKAVIQQGYENAVIVLADMPFVKAAHIWNLIEKARTETVVMSECGGIKMPPAMFRGQALRALGAAKGDRGGKAALGGTPPATLPLSALAARDIDTPDDLAAARGITPPT